MGPIRKAVLILFLIGAIAFVVNLYLDKKTADKISKVAENSVTPYKISENKHPRPSPQSIPAKDDSEVAWNSWLEKQAEQVGRLTENPELIQQHLQESANAIPKNKINWLQSRAKNEKTNMDQRLLAVELLSLNGDVDTLDALESIALTPINEELSAPLKNEATILKAAAIEGFASKENLKDQAISKLTNIAQKTEDKFLQDRAQRSLWYLKGAAEKPETQDTEALKKLLDN
jgi:hypothetical protein